MGKKGGGWFSMVKKVFKSSRKDLPDKKGLMSGLTLSLVDLEVLAMSGTPNDRRHATKILPVVRKQHLLLSTLLLYNAAAMEIYVQCLVTTWGAILISVTLILLFGETQPSISMNRSRS
ncbi:hypothetical protein PVK06_024199 [Gossypium arboreum]|uniref:CNNM transmembrane domain-containing protein n=1 Tax=Gossypium arboreum TaxID=29729 RepID=A0ABR0PDC7_GOSAR|nr:hypothetical protein PVK06_024199 [Gossypium arboreum]